MKVYVVRSTPVQGRVRPKSVVEVNVPRDRRFGDRHGVIRVKIDLFVLQRSPEAFNEYVIAPTALTVHAQRDLVLDRDEIDELRTRELRALVGIEELVTIFGEIRKEAA